MKNYLTLTAIFIKQQLFGRVFPICAAIFVLLFAAFALLCPENQPISAQIGLIYDSSDPQIQAAFEPLLSSQELRFIYYHPDDESTMRRDIMLNRLHCGYIVSTDEKTPITVLESEGSFLTPATDEMVFAAWFESRLSDMAPKLYGGEKHADLIRETMNRQQLCAKPLSLDLMTDGVLVSEQPHASLAELLYAVCAVLCLLCSAFCGMLSRKSEKQTVCLLSASAKSRLIPAASATARALLFFLLLCICEGILALLSVADPFSFSARLSAAAVLSVGCALLSQVFSSAKLRPVHLCGLMIWSAAAVLFSGAVVSPEIFGAASALKWLSPSWLLLKMMSAMS